MGTHVPPSGSGPSATFLRPLGVRDALWCWRLANEPSVRSVSFNTGRPSFGGHLRWVWRWCIRRSGRRAWAIVELSGPPTTLGHVRIGTARFPGPDGSDEYELHIALFPTGRGRGQGRKALELAEAAWPEDAGRLVAYVRRDNEAAARAFSAAAWALTGPTEGQPPEILRFVAGEGGNE
jgi:RimJ/RimL family protein N-acetyltransferase